MMEEDTLATQRMLNESLTNQIETLEAGIRPDRQPMSLSKLREEWCVGESCGMITKDGVFVMLSPTPDPATDPYEMDTP